VVKITATKTTHRKTTITAGKTKARENPSIGTPTEHCFKMSVYVRRENN